MRIHALEGLSVPLWKTRPPEKLALLALLLGPPLAAVLAILWSWKALIQLIP